MLYFAILTDVNEIKTLFEFYWFAFTHHCIDFKDKINTNHNNLLQFRMTVMTFLRVLAGKGNNYLIILIIIICRIIIIVIVKCNCNKTNIQKRLIYLCCYCEYSVKFKMMISEFHLSSAVDEVVQ